MLPIATEETAVEVYRERIRIGYFKAMTRDTKEIEKENPELLLYMLGVYEALKRSFMEEKFDEDVAGELAIPGYDMCLFIYATLRKQAEKDKLTLPKVSGTLVEAFVRRMPTYLIKPPSEMAGILHENPQVLRVLRIMWRDYIEFIVELGRVSEEEARGFANACFNFACGLYELLSEAQEVEEAERIIRR